MSGLKLKKKKRQLPKSYYIQKSVSLKEGFKYSGKNKSCSANTFKDKGDMNIRKRRKNIIKSYSENEITADVAVKPAREEPSKINQFFCQDLKKNNTNSFKNVLTRKRDTENIKNSFPQKEDKDSKRNVDGTTQKTIFVSLNFSENGFKEKVNTKRGLKKLRRLKNRVKSSLKCNPIVKSTKKVKTSDKSKIFGGERGCLKLKNSRVKCTTQEQIGIVLPSRNFEKTEEKKNDTVVCTSGNDIELRTESSNDNISKIDEKYIKSLLCIVNRKGYEENSDNLDCQKLKVTAKIGKLNKENETKEKTIESEINKLKCWYHIKKEIAKEADRYVQKKIIESSDDEVECKTKRNIEEIQFSCRAEKRRKPNRKLKDSVALLFARRDRSLKDVKELWKRNTRTNSVTSLSSETNSDVQNELAELGIESYKHLKKIVEEEVHRICKNYENKKAAPTGNKTNLDSQEINSKNDTQTTQNTIEGVTAKEQDKQNAKKYSTGTGEEPQDKNLHKNKSEVIKEKLKFLAEEKLTNGKFPSQVVKNWSIMHRLQKAFLALGTPTLNGKNLEEFTKIPKINNVKVGDIQNLKQKKSIKEIGTVKNLEDAKRIRKLETKESKIKDCKISEVASIKKDVSKPSEGLIIIKSKKDPVLSKKHQGSKPEKKSDVKTTLLFCNTKKTVDLYQKKEECSLVSQKSFLKIYDKSLNTSLNSSQSREKQENKSGIQKPLKALVCISKNHNNIEKQKTRKSPEKKSEVQFIRSDQTVVLSEGDKSIGNDSANPETSKKVSKTLSNQEKKREKILNEKTRSMIKKETVRNNQKEGEVKGRSILSLRGNKYECKSASIKSPQLQPKRPQEVPKGYKKQSSTKRNFRAGSLISSGSNSSGISTATYNVSKKKGLKKLFKSKKNETSSTSISTPSTNSVGATASETPQTESGQQPLWEQDIKYYHAIVKDIISQYKRINGSLKHSERLDTSGTGLTSLDCHLNLDQVIDIKEYRRKILSEYQTLPIFEYKSMVQGESKKNNTEDTDVKRNLLAVKALNSSMDLDVKDFQPKVQKILDSQVYVDPEQCKKRNFSPRKPLEKQSSLQEAGLNHPKVERKSFSQKLKVPCPSSSTNSKILPKYTAA